MISDKKFTFYLLCDVLCIDSPGSCSIFTSKTSSKIQSAYVPDSPFYVDDHKLITDAWTDMLNADSRFKVVGATNNSALALSLIKESRPDMVLLDISMEPIDGYTLTRDVIGYNNETKVIAVSYYDRPACCSRILEAGASGYVTKTSSGEELVEAIIEVFSGKRYTCVDQSKYHAGSSAAR